MRDIYQEMTSTGTIKKPSKLTWDPHLEPVGMEATKGAVKSVRSLLPRQYSH